VTRKEGDERYLDLGEEYRRPAPKKIACSKEGRGDVQRQELALGGEDEG